MKQEHVKLWGGRFSKATDGIVDDFNASIGIDSRMYRQDILGSMAHARMLGSCGIITTAEADLIIGGLEDILRDIEAGKVVFSIADEDIHMNIERLLIEKIGEAGKKLHTARSRNDQVALDFRMYLKDDIKEIQSLLIRLEETLLKRADECKTVLMPGYTHLQKAQPVTAAFHFMAYFEMFMRDLERFGDCYKRVDLMPLGSGALAATTYPLDRAMVARELGFANITQNAMDGVADRDFAIEFANCCAIFMMHISRFCEEIILWSTHEFGFVELDDAYSTGSSIMPQKKNPDVAELIRGKSGRVFGDLMALLTMMKGLPLAYNKDMQEDKENTFDAADTVKACLLAFIPMFDTMKLKEKNMREKLKGGFLNATDLADYLVTKGMPFRKAHEVSGMIVSHCLQVGCEIEELSLDTLKKFSSLFEQNVYTSIDMEQCVNKRSIVGGPAVAAVSESIARGWRLVEQMKK